MAEPFIAEVRIWANNFAPRGWAFCDGQLLQIAQNTALFSLIGTIYGGDGRTTMAVPNLKDRLCMHPGSGPGLTPRKVGQTGGVTQVTLTSTQMANHNHTANVNLQPGNDDDAAGKVIARAVGANLYAAPANPVAMANEALSVSPAPATSA